jgi:hypothetical protein
VELGERGTRRLSPWRRTLACELLGEIGAHRSVLALLARLEDHRPEVRLAAVRALGEVGSKEAVPALSTAFLQRRVAPTNIVNNALRRIGGEAASAFERGITSDDPDAITRSVRPFEVHPDSCMAAGGGIRVANGSRIAGGRVVAPGVAWRGVGATQVLEYIRGFSATRIAWSKINGLLIISGAFGVFRRDVLVALGGFSHETLGEDMEMTMRIHHVLRPQMKDA